MRVIFIILALLMGIWIVLNLILMAMGVIVPSAEIFTLMAIDILLVTFWGKVGAFNKDFWSQV